MNYSLLLLVFFAVVPYIHGTISDLRLCADPECRGALSSGIATLRYSSIEPMVLSFNVGDEITIYSKDAGINRELWGAEIKGKRGYVPKRLIREMRVFIKTPTYQVPTELHLQPPSSQSAFNPQQPQQQQQPQQLLQPQQQQQPPQQQQQQPQQPQLYQQPLQQGGPQGNFIPHQQQPMAPNVNPQFQNNNQLPNQPIPMQHTPPLQQQQPKPMMQQQAPPITTTSTVPLTTETQLPSEIMETDAEKPLPIQAKLLSFKEPPAPVLPLETSLNPEKVGEGKEVEEESEDEEEEDGDDELDENESEDSADNEEFNDRNFIVEDVVKVSLESKDEETRLEKEKDSNAGPVDLPSMDSPSEDTFQTKTPNIDPIIDIGDLAGVDSSAINSLHIRSIEDKIENPISINKEPINSSSIADVPISITSSETIKTEALPTNQVVEEALLIDQETVENTTTEDSSLPGDPVIAIEKESIDIQAKEVVVDSATEDVESKLMFTEETVRVDQPVEVIDQQPPMEMLNPPSASEPIQSQVISSTSSESVAISDPVVENQQPVESHVDKGEAQETVLLEEPPTEPPQTEVVSQESVAGSSSDVNLSSSDVEKSSDETKTPGSDGSGGGFLDSALNWLGLSDTDEPLKTEQVDVESTDPAPLQQQIAAMNPSDQDSHQQQPTIPSVLDGFCDTQDCPKLVESTATESIQVDSHNHHANDQHHHHVNDGHNHHHDNDGHGHHHHHHHHDDTGFGHGHSHIPGYIPGFRHHYKPPVAQAQVAPPAELPPVELAAPATEKIAEEPVAHQPAEQLISPPVAENLNPLPTATEQLDQSNPIVEQAIPRPVGPLPSEVSVQESVASTVPEYIPVEEIFRAEMEKNRLLHEQQLKAEKETNLFDWLSSTISSLSEGKLDSGSGSPANLYLALLMSVTMVAFLTLYYAVTSKSGEKILKAKISQLDKQLYESQTAKEETTSIQSKLTEYETNAAELRSLKEQADAEKASLSKRIATLERERDLLEKEVEAATETATEANRMFEELLSSQSENDQWQRSVEVLQQQLNKQQQTMENLNSSLCVKTAENETLNVEVEELRTESERYKVRIKTLQSDLETLKTSNRNYQQKMAQDSADLMKLKQEKESWVTERRAMSSQINRHSKEVEEWRDKTEQLKKSIKAKESDLAKSLQLLKESGNDSQTVLQLTSLVQLESQLSEANETVEKLRQQVQTHQEEFQRFQEEKAALQLRVSELKASGEAAAKQKHEAETRLEVLSNYFKEKETQLQKELGTHEAKRAITEENVSESVKRILETEESLIQYKSQVETLTKEIEEQERSYKSRLATQEKRAHENWVAARQLERRLEETKQEAAQLRHRLTQVEKDKEALLVAKENGTANGVVDVDLIKPVIKRPVLGIGVSNNEDLTMMEHPPLLSPPIPPPPGMELGLGGPPPPGMPFDSLFPPPHFIPPAPFMPPDAGMLPPMHLMPSIPPPPSGMLADHHRPPPLGMIATGSFDVDYRRELSDPPPPRRYPSPPRRYPSPLGSERSVRSDRSDRMDRYDDHFRPVSPYGRHGGRPRSVGRSRDVSPERPRSYSPLPSPLYPPHTTIHSPEDWDDGRNYNRAPMMRSGSLRHPPSGPKTSSPLIQPLDNGDRHRPQPH